MDSRQIWRIRQADPGELEALVALRRKMLEDVGFDEPAELDRTDAAVRGYFAEHMPTGAFRVWVAVVDEAAQRGIVDVADSADEHSGISSRGADDKRRAMPIASIGLVIHSTPPSPHNLVGQVGYIMNLVTLPPWRRRGIAHALLEHVLGVLREEGIPVASLHASAEGRTLYEDLGFKARDTLPEMLLRLHPSSSTNSIPSGK